MRRRCVARRARARAPASGSPSSAIVPAAGGVQARDAARDRRLAAARLADERDAAARARSSNETSVGRRPRGRAAAAVHRLEPRRPEQRPARACARGARRRRGARAVERRRRAPLEAAHGVVRRRRPRAAASRLAARLARSAQRGANAQPAGRSPTPTATPGMPRSRRAARRDRGSRRRARACTGGAGASSTVRPAPASTMRPAVHDRDPVGDLRDHRQVVRDVDHRQPVLGRAAAGSRRGSRACVTTSSPVVGSSSTTSGGPHDERHRDHHALLLAAGELVRDSAAGTPASSGRLHAAERLRDRRPRALGRRCARSTSPIASPTRSDGLRLVAGLLRHVRDEPPAQRRAARLVARPTPLAGDRDLAARDPQPGRA